MNVNKRLAIILVIVTLLLQSFVVNSENLVKFPGEKSEIVSPDKKYVLYNVDLEYVEPHHFLFLVDTKNRNHEKLYEYGRYVDVLWSTDGDGLIINDFGGSDYSNTIIFLFGDTKKRIDIKDELRQRMKDNKSIFGNHHVYIEGVKWLSKNRIKIKISGYGDVDPDGFTLWYEYTIGDGFKS